MRRFARLISALERKDAPQAELLATYFRDASRGDRLWAIALLAGNRPTRLITAREMRALAQRQAGLPDWLVTECQSVVGDQAETTTLILPDPAQDDLHDLDWWMRRIGDLAQLDAPDRAELIAQAWLRLGSAERYLFNKLLTGSMRLQVETGIIARALPRDGGQTVENLAFRLQRDWSPGSADYDTLLHGEAPEAEAAQPYPFAEPAPFEAGLAQRTEVADWIIEYRLPGLAAQMVVRGGRVYPWSDAARYLGRALPELRALADFLPEGCVMSGTLLAGAPDAPLPQKSLLVRLARRRVTARQMAETPVCFVASDLFEADGIDLRDRPFAARRATLERMLAGMPAIAALAISSEMTCDGWTEVDAMRAASRGRGSMGLRLTRRDAVQGGFFWAPEPLQCRAVLIYAEADPAMRGNALGLLSFALWRGKELVPVCKLGPALPDEQVAELGRWIRDNTAEKFGPLRAVKPELVFALEFDGVAANARRKSGLDLSHPRVTEWLRDQPAAGASHLQELQAHLGAAHPER